MSAIANPEVFVYFNLSDEPGAEVFLLDDSTQGKLDDVTYILGGDRPVDITPWVSGVSIRRGRNRRLDQFQAGSCTIDLVDLQSEFLDEGLMDSTLTNDSMVTLTDDVGRDLTISPRPWDSDDLVPGKRIDVFAPGGGLSLFSGYVDTWEHKYDPTGMVVAGITATDKLSSLAIAELEQWVPTAQLAGDRISAALSRTEVEFGGVPTDISPGISTLVTHNVPAGTKLLSYLQTCTKSDRGNLYVDRRGTLVYRDRYEYVTPGAATTSFSDQATSTALKYSAIEVDHNTDLLYTRVIALRDSAFTGAGVRQIAEDATARELYGQRPLSLTGLLVDDAEALNIAQALLAKYKSPGARVSAITVKVEALPIEQRLELLALDMGSVIDVEWQPAGTTVPVTTPHVVENITHRTTVSDLWMVRLELSNEGLEVAQLFLLGDATKGQLDSDYILGF